MRSVRQAIEIMSRITGEPLARVNQIARRLIDDGLLPKSSGRDIKEISPYHAGLLLSALALSDRIADASTVARQMAELPSQVPAKGRLRRLCKQIGVPADAPFGEALGHLLSPENETQFDIEVSRDNAGNLEGEIKVEVAYKDLHDRSVDYVAWSEKGGAVGRTSLHYWAGVPGHVARRSYILDANGVTALRWLLSGDND